jgi:hypothetical protein
MGFVLVDFINIFTIGIAIIRVRTIKAAYSNISSSLLVFDKYSYKFLGFRDYFSL